MGQRANLVVIERGRRTLYYDHWCANVLDVELFWGPRLALQFIAQREPEAEPDGWLDTIWCEGAAVLDLDQSILLWFGGEDILHDVPLRRAHLQLMAELWPGWEIRWAHEGILSIADQLGLQRARFVARPKDDTPEPLWFSADYPEGNSVVTSLRRNDGVLLVGRLCGDEDALRVGPELIDVIAAHASTDTLRWDGEFPVGGIHVDCVNRTLDTWWAADTHELLAQTCAAWPGWGVRGHRDSYERHVALADGKLVLTPAANLTTKVLEHLEANLVRHARNPARELLPRLGSNTQLNPATDSARGSVGDPDEKRALLASLSVVRAQRG